MTNPPDPSTRHGDRAPAGSDVNEDGTPSYHDLHITTAQIPRTSIFNLPYGVEVSCTRVTGWRVYRHDLSRAIRTDGELLAGEYDGPDMWLVLDVGGHVIVDSHQRAEPG